MNLQEQRHTLERMLGERMLRHADSVMRSWATELGEESFFARLDALSEWYDRIWQEYLAENSESGIAGDEVQNAMNTITYRYYLLLDQLYDKIRLKRGVSPTMSGFGKDNIESITTYFAQNLNRKKEDLDWVYELAQDEDKQATAVTAIAAIAVNLKTGFDEDSLMLLLEIAALDTLASEQALAQAMLIMAFYDMRMDFFVELQDEWLRILEKKSEHALAAIGALIEQSEVAEQLPETWVFSVVCDTDQKRVDIARTYIKKGMDEQAYDGCLMGRLDLCGDDEVLQADMLLYDELWDEALEKYLQIEERGNGTPHVRFRIGWCALLTGDYDTAERYMIARLRDTKHVRKEDYINYGHLCWLRGDRVTAFENYREVRRQCQTIKEWKELFCPDRKVISQLGIPLDEVYMMEDRLLKL